MGARSALFLPFPDLGLVIVDEEHETAFKQEDGVVYTTRATWPWCGRDCHRRAGRAGFGHAKPGEPGQRRSRPLPPRAARRTPWRCEPACRAALVDLRESQPARGRFLSPALIDAVNETFARGEQAMLFLNRRGYAPLTLCRACGHRLACPNCTAWLVEHRARRQLTCHHCGHTEPIPSACPVCKAEATLAPIGPGVERITEEAAHRFSRMQAPARHGQRHDARPPGRR